MAMKYLGGAWIQGVPARDLTDEEQERHLPTIREQKKLTGITLYEEVRPARKPDKPAAEEDK